MATGEDIFTFCHADSCSLTLEHGPNAIGAPRHGRQTWQRPGTVARGIR